jgi:hypothetical protein
MQTINVIYKHVLRPKGDLLIQVWLYMLIYIDRIAFKASSVKHNIETIDLPLCLFHNQSFIKVHTNIFVKFTHL